MAETAIFGLGGTGRHAQDFGRQQAWNFSIFCPLHSWLITYQVFITSKYNLCSLPLFLYVRDETIFTSSKYNSSQYDIRCGLEPVNHRLRPVVTRPGHVFAASDGRCLCRYLHVCLCIARTHPPVSHPVTSRVTTLTRRRGTSTYRVCTSSCARRTFSRDVQQCEWTSFSDGRLLDAASNANIKHSS